MSGMKTFSLSDLQYIKRETLADRIRAKDDGIAIIDVRDSDYIGGHIINCKNVPTDSHDYRMPELVRTLKEKDVVVFHCALSQQRGPASALRYLRERQRVQERGELGTRKDGSDVTESQRVYVLEGGFTKWQEKYGENKDLTESYDKEIWQFGQ